MSEQWSNVSRIKLKNGKEINMLIMSNKEHGIVGFRAVKYRDGVRNYILISKSEYPKLKFDMAILYDQMYKVNKKQIEYKITDIKYKTIFSTIKKYKKHNKNNLNIEVKEELLLRSDLHKELHRLKKKIEICKINNEDYSKLEERLNKILRELNYSDNTKRDNYKPFNGYRVAVNKGYIKIYGIN